MPVLAVVADLVFRAKIEAAAARAGVAVAFAAAGQPLPQPSGAAWRAVLVDLHDAPGDPLEAIRRLRREHPAVPLIGFCSHVDRQLQQQARAAGCSLVLPRSVFVQRLPELLAGG